MKVTFIFQFNDTTGQRRAPGRPRITEMGGRGAPWIGWATTLKRLCLAGPLVMIDARLHYFLAALSGDTSGPIFTFQRTYPHPSYSTEPFRLHY